MPETSPCAGPHPAPLAWSWRRMWAVFVKELTHMRRDRLTLAMAVGVPVLQLVLFGYAINTDPRALPTAVVSASSGPLTRSVVAALQTSGYFAIASSQLDDAQALAQLEAGQVQFVIHIAPTFEADLLRGRPAILGVSADATDPAAGGNALAALPQLVQQALQTQAIGPLAHLQRPPPLVELRVHRRYNPEGLSRINIVPGLIGTILTMTLVMLTALAMTRERERGTLENLLATPVTPLEVMLGKILPYVLIGYVQLLVIVLAARVLFDVPLVGSLGLLAAFIGLFIVANLAVGFTFSTLARNQLQAMQMTFFFFLPSMLLSGFMFPFRGMPLWAQRLGEVLPLTHFLRIVRGILLKGNMAAQLWADVWPMASFALTAVLVALWRYRRTLD